MTVFKLEHWFSPASDSDSNENYIYHQQNWVFSCQLKIADFSASIQCKPIPYSKSLYIYRYIYTYIHTHTQEDNHYEGCCIKYIERKTYPERLEFNVVYLGGDPK